MWAMRLYGENCEKGILSPGENIADDQSNKNYVHNISDPKVLSAAVLGM